MQGVYKITNKVDGKYYVGSSVNILKRLGEHRMTLTGYRHDNSYLQHAWNKFGASSFSFEVVELVDAKENVREREQFWMDSLSACNRDHGYNLAPTAGSMTGYVFSKELRERIANSLRGKPSYKRTEQHKEKMAAIKRNKRRNPFSEEWRAKITKNVTGETNPNAKLSLENVIDIKTMLALGYSCVAIARQYNVCSVLISRIKHGKAWVSVA